MQTLSEHQLLLALLALAVVLLISRSAGEIARRFDQPEVLGQLLGGFLLGPSVFGAILPAAYHALFFTGPVGFVMSGFSWIGAVLLLLVAGMEVDLQVLRSEARPGSLAAALAIVPSLAAGAIFAWFFLRAGASSALFLGIVLSVTAVSVAATILMEREQMRRRYAQVILAAGVGSEVLVWLFVSVVSAFRSASPLLAGVRSTAFAVAFFLFMMTAGRRLTFWAMRRVRDATWITNGPLSLVLVLTFGAAAITQALGLHALLGAFVFGVLLGRAPRNDERLTRGIQFLTIGLFGPIFFALAGMRVDILQLRSLSAVGLVLLLLAIATAVKVGCSALGARLGGRHGWEAALVGFGLNLKGGTDVVVAVVGTELGLLTTRAYSMYAVVAIATVLFTPGLMSFLEARAPVSQEEKERLEREEARRRAYVPRLERVLVPLQKQLLPTLVASLVQRIAVSKHEHGELFDITELDVEPNGRRAPDKTHAQETLDAAAQLKQVEVSQKHVESPDVADIILRASVDHDLIAIGAHPPQNGKLLTLGKLQDRIIHEAKSDVLVAVNAAESLDCSKVRAILVPTNGLEYSMAAGDVAGSLAESCGAEVVLMNVVHSDMDELFWRERDERRLKENAHGMMTELAFRLGRLGVSVSERVRVGGNAVEEILAELQRRDYDLLVLGTVDRGQNGRPYLGRSARDVLRKTQIPVVLLVSHQSVEH
ncbi:MAG TPA: cation:proton antiporter [Chloroflexota bacterium]|nr:cation:proton antiporter [Chloroflexota bacterium]